LSFHGAGTKGSSRLCPCFNQQTIDRHREQLCVWSTRERGVRSTNIGVLWEAKNIVFSKSGRGGICLAVQYIDLWM
jgi:hypothetical protein